MNGQEQGVDSAPAICSLSDKHSFLGTFKCSFKEKIAFKNVFSFQQQFFYPMINILPVNLQKMSLIYLYDVMSRVSAHNAAVFSQT